MKLLLDTNTFIWASGDVKRLSPTAANLLLDRNNDLHLSKVSVWEMQIKVQLGKLNLSLPLPQLIQEETDENDLQILPIELEHIYALEHLPVHHKDPFDRLLIAQAQTENLMIVSNDPAFSNYQVNLIW